ncbi:hypothetical protein OG455_37020 [Kitasatospora sp. NBC_01287]|uniref:hypothetical protein n=1 Tax=Kitasatospora sp. NBC_01287 TaxID=2903573 RepID=UPI002253170C|nr:hypothetical protein [Kitasatospora sp. NBC_01287]MCX4751043.1 hypothetical protein [Kitasatospora sp. NBC_01287]
MTTDDATIPAVGARGLDEVLDATRAASRHTSPCTGFEHGVLASYQWATGARPEAPVTALGSGGPCRDQLFAECRNAAVKLRAALHDGADAGYALGAYQALAWLCGLHDDLP